MIRLTINKITYIFFSNLLVKTAGTIPTIAFPICSTNLNTKNIIKVRKLIKIGS